MTDSVVKEIIINGGKYRILCERGEISKINELSRRLDERVKRIAESSGGKLNDAMLLLFAALELEDIALNSEEDKEKAKRKKIDEEKIIDYTVAAIEKLTKKVENQS